MTPLSLQKALAEDLQSLFDGFVDLKQNCAAGKMKIYENASPIQMDNQNEDDIYPYIVVRLTGGEVPEDYDTRPTANVVILIGYYDPDLSNDGNKYVMTAIHRIIERFRKNSLLADMYNQTGNIEWTMSDEDTYPYFFGGLQMTFTLPKIERESDYC